jgi:hypothetical protein
VGIAKVATGDWALENGEACFKPKDGAGWFSCQWAKNTNKIDNIKMFRSLDWLL